MPTWLLPEKIADVLPSEARKIEELRRSFLDRFRVYGYEMVVPPMLEYLESLLTGAGKDMDLRTFKLVDQVSGRSMGIRADMTTQVARIDAHLLNRASVTRLCYAGSVLQTEPSGLHATREPFQIGAEIYGHAGLEADAEIQELVLSSLELIGMKAVRIDLCHVGVLKAILQLDPVAKRDEDILFTLLESKDVPELQAISANYEPVVRDALLALPSLYGDLSVIEKAAQILPRTTGIQNALNDLQYLGEIAGKEHVTVDLSDLRGYHYHSGVMFSVFVDGLPNAVARGGRYDQVGEAFGRARPATGFSLDLRELARLMPVAERKPAIRAPWGNDPALRSRIRELRDQGEIVIQVMPGHENEQDEFECKQSLVCSEGQWILQNVD
ncbi:ATP phosphoribosyltransferase regulatory subunit [Undibacterium luofuense]|uniref:ATP phosphoribosyltransferase regulatory subunit n=1 Tax=Undibacterium luofuense TaxID=2828733 RepID=UPI0030EBA9D6